MTVIKFTSALRRLIFGLDSFVSDSSPDCTSLKGTKMAKPTLRFRAVI
jgi:hypothetical protein